jgi:hypothetical protein
VISVDEQNASIASLSQVRTRRKGQSKKSIENIARSVSGGPEDVFYVTPVILAGTGQTVATEDAWTPVNVPTKSKYALIQFEAEATGDSDVGILYFEDYRSGAQIDVCFIDADEDDAQPNAFMKVPLNKGSFRYKFDSSAGSPDFRIRYIAYYPD